MLHQKCLEFTPTVENVLANYMDKIYGRYDVSATKPSWNLREFDAACSTARTKYDELAMSTKAEVEKPYPEEIRPI